MKKIFLIDKTDSRRVKVPRAVFVALMPIVDGLKEDKRNYKEVLKSSDERQSLNEWLLNNKGTFELGLKEGFTCDLFESFSETAGVTYTQSIKNKRKHNMLEKKSETKEEDLEMPKNKQIKKVDKRPVKGMAEAVVETAGNKEKSQGIKDLVVEMLKADNCTKEQLVVAVCEKFKKQTEPTLKYLNVMFNKLKKKGGLERVSLDEKGRGLYHIK